MEKRNSCRSCGSERNDGSFYSVESRARDKPMATALSRHSSLATENVQRSRPYVDDRGLEASSINARLIVSFVE